VLTGSGKPYLEALETGPKAQDDATCYELMLFVSGASKLSARAIADAKRLCDSHLAGRYHLDVVDINEESAVLCPGLLVSPTLIKIRPLPERKHVGDLSDAADVLEMLGIPAAGAPLALAEGVRLCKS
jgi:circadian clock protein KaiB